MKKVLATVAALGLVVGVTANAFAADQPTTPRASESESTTAPRVPQPTAPGVALWSVAGQWQLVGAYLSNGMGGNNTTDSTPGGAAIQDGGGTDSDSHDAWYIYSFKVLPTLQVNDKISMKGEVRFVDRCIAGTSCTTSSASRDADFKHVYMEWMSPWGKTRFGRAPAGAWGTKFIDNTNQGDRLMWWLNMLPENWGSLIFTQKVTEDESVAGPNISTQDTTAYYVDLSYKAGFGKTTAALWTVDRGFAMRDNENDDTVYTTNLWVTGNYTWNAFNLEYELNFAFGDGVPLIDEEDTSDVAAYGMYFDGSYKIQDWTIGGLFFYLSGDDDLTDNDQDALFSAAGTGIDFNPYQILTGDYMGILNPDKGSVHPSIIGQAELALDDQTNAGAWSVGAYTRWAMSPTLSFNAVVGYASAAETPKGYDDDYGIEANVGMQYKIMDNLTYNALFGYLWTGDYFTQNDLVDTQDVWLAAHALSMKF